MCVWDTLLTYPPEFHCLPLEPPMKFIRVEYQNILAPAIFGNFATNLTISITRRQYEEILRALRKA